MWENEGILFLSVPGAAIGVSYMRKLIFAKKHLNRYFQDCLQKVIYLLSPTWRAVGAEIYLEKMLLRNISPISTESLRHSISSTAVMKWETHPLYKITRLKGWKTGLLMSALSFTPDFFILIIFLKGVLLLPLFILLTYRVNLDTKFVLLWKCE